MNCLDWTVQIHVNAFVTYLLCVTEVAIEVEWDAGVLHDAGAVEHEHQVVPLTLQVQIRVPELHQVVRQPRLTVVVRGRWYNRP